jgi:hypothetical protein
MATPKFEVGANRRCTALTISRALADADMNSPSPSVWRANSSAPVNKNLIPGRFVLVIKARATPLSWPGAKSTRVNKSSTRGVASNAAKASIVLVNAATSWPASISLAAI